MARLLFIQYKKSGNVLEGGGQGSAKNFAHLCELLGAENVEEMHIHDETIKRRKSEYISGMYYFLSDYFFGLTPKRVQDIVRHAIDGNFDYVFIDRSIFGRIAEGLKKAGFKGTIITFFHNVERDYFAAKVSPWAPWRPIILHCAYVNDSLACKYSDRIAVLNSRDDARLFQLYSRHGDVMIPVTFRDSLDVNATRSAVQSGALTSHKPLCVFLGAYFRANNCGIKWFVKNVYPYVDIQMKIVGKGMDRLEGAPWLRKEIEVFSDVPDLGPIFDEADIMVLPIFEGSGMKVKTCESLMHGKNIIATPEAFEGYELDYCRAGALCRNSQDFIKALNAFSTHPRTRFNSYTRSIFLTKYSDATVDPAYRKLLEF
jgi:hypothetical protein